MKIILMSFLLACTVLLYAFSLGKSEAGETSNAEYDGISIIQIEGVFCDIAYTGTDSNQVRVTAALSDKRTKICRNTDNGRLHIWVERDWLFSFGVSGTNKISITGPARMKIEVNNASGDVYVKNVDSDRLNLRTASGNVSIENSLGSKTVITASGSVKIRKSDGSLSVSSFSGSQEIEDLEGRANAHSMSGSIKARNIKGDMEVQTVSGSVELENTNGSIGCKTTSGRIRGRNITLTDDSQFTTVSGEIVCTLDDQEKYRFDLATVSGSLEAGSSRGGKHLSTGNGTIDVSASSVSGSVRFR